MKEPSANPFVFACGVPRSGTTLLQRMLNAHPELAVANDSHFIPRALELTNRELIPLAQAGEKVGLTEELLENVFNYHRFVRLGISASEFQAISDQSESYQELVAKLYSKFAAKQGKALGGEKTPDYLRRLKLMHGLFPKSKLIHIVRDGRNVALSLMDWATPTKGPGRIALWQENPLAVCALWWKWLVMEAHQQASELPKSSFKQLNYETLVDQPEPELKSICEFLGLQYRDEMANYHRGKTKKNKTLSAKSAWLGPQQGLRNWQNSMPAEQIELFELLAGDALELYGYQLSGAKASKQASQDADACLKWWDEHFLAKSKKPSKSKSETSPDNPLLAREKLQMKKVD